MKILVVGGTGPLGLEVLKQGLALGHNITAMVRRPEHFQSPSPKIRVVQGDLTDASSLPAAVQGQEAVISCFGTKLSRKPTTLLSDGTRHLIASMKEQGVNRLICVTGIGAGDSKGHGGFFYDKIFEPLLLREIYKDKTRQEEIIRQSGLDWVIARPAVLTNGPKIGTFLVETDLKGFRATKISRADVAAFLLQQLSANQWLGTAPVLSYAA